MAGRVGRARRRLTIEAVDVGKESQQDRVEFGDEWILFLARTVNRLVENGKLRVVDGIVTVEHQGENK